jgi:hypothetical protein
LAGDAESYSETNVYAETYTNRDAIAYRDCHGGIDPDAAFSHSYVSSSHTHT